MIGKTVGHFKILAKVGSGGMGVVYKAEDLSLNRIVALKSLLPTAIHDAQEMDRLLQEAKTASILDHQNICTIHEVLQTGEGQVFIAMAYYQGETVAHKLRYGPLPPAQAIPIALDVACGLGKAHRHGIIHRDIKPGNIVVTTDGIAKILDFGIAKLLSGSTGKDVPAGTVAYMSPEQLRGESVDQRSDIWSWAVVLFEMLTGRAPFRCADTNELKDAILYYPLDLTALLQSGLPGGLARLLSKCLEEDRVSRYVQIEDALRDLERCWPHEARTHFRAQQETAPPAASNSGKQTQRNLRAYNLYLKGRYQWNRESPDALFKAAATFAEASEADPTYALPLCGLAECYLVIGAKALLPPAEAWRKARHAAIQALALDPALAEAHGCLGAVLAINDFDWTAAEQQFRYALELDPASAVAHNWYAIALLAPQGRFNQAIAQLTRGIESEPLSLIYNSTLGWICYLSQQWGLATGQCMKTLEIDPHHVDSLWCLGESQVELGQFDQAIVTLENLYAVSGGVPFVFGALGHAHTKAGNFAQASSILRTMRRADHGIYSSPVCEAWILANLPGEEEQALDCLEKAYAERDFLIRFIHFSPALRPLYAHPRFHRLLRRMNLELAVAPAQDQTVTLFLAAIA